MVHNGPKLLKWSFIYRKWSNFVINGSKFSKLIPNCLNLLEMVKNCQNLSKRFKWVQKGP